MTQTEIQEALKKLDAALNALNTPENAVSPAEKQLIAFFHTLDEADKAAAMSDVRYTAEEVFSRVRKGVHGKKTI